MAGLVGCMVGLVECVTDLVECVAGLVGCMAGTNKQQTNLGIFFSMLGSNCFFLKLRTLEICISEERKKILCICEASGAEIN